MGVIDRLNQVLDGQTAQEPEAEAGSQPGAAPAPDNTVAESVEDARPAAPVQSTTPATPGTALATTDESSLTIARKMVGELDKFSEGNDIQASRAQILERLQNVFLASRFESMRISEEVKAAFIKDLDVRRSDMSHHASIRALEAITNAGGSDEFLTMISGQPPTRKGAVSLSVNQTNVTQDKAVNISTGLQGARVDDSGGVSKPQKDILGVLESLTVVKDALESNPTIIDVESVGDNDDK